MSGVQEKKGDCTQFEGLLFVGSDVFLMSNLKVVTDAAVHLKDV